MEAIATELQSSRCQAEDFVISWMGQGEGKRSLSSSCGSFEGSNKGKKGQHVRAGLHQSEKANEWSTKEGWRLGQRALSNLMKRSTGLTEYGDQVTAGGLQEPNDS